MLKVAFENIYGEFEQRYTWILFLNYLYISKCISLKLSGKSG
jgi:hypothetical protein